MSDMIMKVPKETRDKIMNDINLKLMVGGGSPTSADQFAKHIFDELDKHGQFILIIE